MDHGIDWLGDNEQHEELNHIVEGNAYGWPYVYADSKFNPQDEPPGRITMEDWAKASTEPVGLYTPHAAPMQLAWYTGEQFPEAYRGDAFIAMRGSWNRKPPSGYEVVRIRFENGEPTGFEAFVTGFLMQTENGRWGHLGRLAGLAMAADGALLLSDDTNGVIYRISHTGDGAEQAEDARQPTNAAGAEVGMRSGATPGMQAQADQSPDRLALDVLGVDGGSLKVTSSAFSDGEPIPGVHAAEQQNISPPLAWTGGPLGAGSYVLMLEDPDAGPQPFVHWTLYNIQPDVTELREGVPGQPRLVLPEGASQGRNDRGSTGYYGMRPPVGEPPHHYVVQLFALDRELDLPDGASRAELLAAMRGHVLATGRLAGTYQRP